jgi:alkanesulfonate monooxygenase SsuD/methylene tetrahydromethanopterin reductase-like flavin-dependent oxidoreductase (luciferase family)
VQYGICVASRPADVGYVVEAERLGFTHCWAADSQMIWSDAYAFMALAADRTSTMHIGTGVAVAPTRPAPVTAAAHATINEIAPGRVFCAIGTGNTAMRIMGHPPMRIAEFDRYLSDLRAFLDGGEVDYEFRGRIAPTHHLMPDSGFVRFEPRIPMHVSAFGPKAMALAARHGDGLVTSLPPDPMAVAHARQRLESAAAEAGRTIARETFPISTLTTIFILAEGETVDSERVRRGTGAFAIASLHYSYEQVTQFGKRPPAHLADIWDDYTAHLERTPLERRHLAIHRGHNCWVEPDEEVFVTGELIERTCLVGTPEQLRRRVADLEAAGLDQLILLPPLDAKESVIADVASALITG